eukprot:157290_1
MSLTNPNSNPHHSQRCNNKSKQNATIFLFIFITACVVFVGTKCQSSITQDDVSDTEVSSKEKYFPMSDRIITNIILDKPIYRQSEIIYLTAFLFDGVSMMPEQGNKSQHIHVQIIDANNIAIFDTQQWVEIKNSIIGFQYKIPSDTKGGEYKIKIKYHWTAHKTVAERSFQILTSNNKLNPKIRKQVEFLKNVYSPGEQCEIKISCIDCNNNVLIASIVAKIDDHIIYELSNSSPMTLSYDIGKIDN